MLLRRGADLPPDVACAVLGPVAATLDALHRRGRSHGAVSATQVTVSLRDGELGVELAEPIDGPLDGRVEEPDGDSRGYSHPRGAPPEGHSTGGTPRLGAGIPGDVVSFGSLVVRCLVRTLGPDDRRSLARGHDPVTGRRATSCAALVDAARVAVTPLPGDGTGAMDFWDERPGPLEDLRATSRSGRTTRRHPTHRGRRLAAVAASTVGVVALATVLISRASGGSPTMAPSHAPTPTTTTGHPVPTTTSVPAPAPPSTAGSGEPQRYSVPALPGARGAAAALRAFVPTALRDGCRAPDGPGGTLADDLALAVLECGTDAIPVHYSLFSDVEEMNAAFAATAPAGLRGPTALSGPPRCLDGETEERAWSRSAGDPAAGRYRCEIDPGGAALVWTTDSVAVLGRASADTGEPSAVLGALYRLWRTVLGPVTP